MNEKTISQTNPHLKDPTAAHRRRVRSLASSTAIETGEPIRVIEEKINRTHSTQPRVTLA